MTIRLRSNQNEPIDYSVDNALYYLGPADFGTEEMYEGCFYPCMLIQHICITIMRVYNVLFGDGLWYTNKIARDLVQEHFNHPTNSAELDRKINCIFNELRSRSAGSCSFADTINPPSPPNAEQFIRPTLDRFAHAPSLTPSATSLESESRKRFKMFFQQGKTGNIHLLNLQGHYENSAREFMQILPNLEQSLESYEYRIPEIAERSASGALQENCIRVYQELCAALCPRAYTPTAELANGIVSEKNSLYASAKDPYDLFKAALADALRELEVPVSSLYNPVFVEAQDMLNAYRLAIFKLLAQANLDVNSCTGPKVAFNHHLSAMYQRPKLTFAPDNTGEIEPKIFFTADILSTTNTGCDPVGAISILKSFEKAGMLDICKNHIIGHQESIHALMDTLKGQIDTMAEQMKERYGQHIIPMIIADFHENQETPNEPPPANFEALDFSGATAEAQTPYQLIKLGMLWASQKYATLGLLNENDVLGGPAYPYLRKLIGRTVVFEILNRAAVINDFNIKLTNALELDCGKFYEYLPASDHSNTLTPHLRYIPHELGGDGTEDDLATDPIKAKSLMNKLSPSEILLLEKYLLASSLKQLYALKEITDENLLDLDERVRVELQQIQPDRQRIIQEIYAEIAAIEQHVSDHYFNLFSCDILDTVRIPENAPVTAVAFIHPQTEHNLLKQDVQWQFLPEDIRKDVIIKNRPIRTIGAAQKATLKDFQSKGRSGAIDAQNYVIHNPARAGDCMFGALALEIFGLHIVQNIDHYVTILRKAVVDYILTHKEQFRDGMAKETDQPYPYEREENFLKRIEPELDRRLEEYCHAIQDRQEWGTGLELEAIAEIFGVPIHIFYVNKLMRIGSDGIEDGVIQPNSILGSKYDGAPIRLKYTGTHYCPIHLIT